MDEERKETKHEANDEMTLCNEKSWSFAFLTKLLCYAMVHMQYRSRLVQVLVLREIRGADDIAVKCKSNTPEFGTKTCSARFVVIPRSAICSLYHNADSSSWAIIFEKSLRTVNWSRSILYNGFSSHQIRGGYTEQWKACHRVQPVVKKYLTCPSRRIRTKNELKIVNLTHRDKFSPLTNFFYEIKQSWTIVFSYGFL